MLGVNHVMLDFEPEEGEVAELEEEEAAAAAEGPETEQVEQARGAVVVASSETAGDPAAVVATKTTIDAAADGGSGEGAESATTLAKKPRSVPRLKPLCVVVVSISSMSLFGVNMAQSSSSVVVALVLARQPPPPVRIRFARECSLF